MLKKILFVVGCAMTFYGTAQANPFAVRDSIGVTNQNGKTFITHRVEPKETLYAISRKYGVTVAQIVSANQNVEKSLNIGQVILVPMRAGRTVPATATASTTLPATAPVAASVPATTAANTATGKTFVVDSNGNKVHTVEARQTLYAISRMYGVTVEDIKRWNNLPDNNVTIGSNLIVGTGAKAVAQTAEKKPVYVPEHDEEVSLPKQASTTASTTPATTPVSTTPAKPAAEPEKTVNRSTDYSSRVSESGMAELIEQKNETNKFLALHKTAPVGTIMAVKNPMNDQTVYVRVIGKLPDTGANNNVIVKLSKKACQQIGVTDQRFRVELSYMP